MEHCLQSEEALVKTAFPGSQLRFAVLYTWHLHLSCLFQMAEGWMCSSFGIALSSS